MSDRVGSQPRDTSKKRRKEGSELVPKTSFRPIAAPGKLHALTRPDDVLKDKTLVYEDMVRVFVASKVPIFLWGSFGSGKTRGVQALANECDENGTPYQVITIQPSTIDSSVLHGLMTVVRDPVTQTTIMERSIPEPAQQVWNYFNDKDGLTIMFLDEMTTCTNSQQNALLGLLTHGQYGDLDISPYTTFCCAANPPQTVQTVNPLSEAVINRGGHIPWYTNGDEWLKKWKTGFGSVIKRPDADTAKFAETLLSFDKDVSFRADPDHYDDPEDMWDINDLCPYDQMELSARSITEALKVYKIISDTFKAAPYEVRKLYVAEAMTAMLGPRWGRNSAFAYDVIEQSVGITPAVDAVRDHNISYVMTHREIVDLVGDRLHRNKGELMRADQEQALAEEFVQEIFAGEDISHTTYAAFWVWLSTSPHRGAREAIIPTAFDILMKVIDEKNSYLSSLPKKAIIPAYVPQEIKDELKELSALYQARK